MLFDVFIIRDMTSDRVTCFRLFQDKSIIDIISDPDGTYIVNPWHLYLSVEYIAVAWLAYVLL